MVASSARRVHSARPSPHAAGAHPSVSRPLRPCRLACGQPEVQSSPLYRSHYTYIALYVSLLNPHIRYTIHYTFVLYTIHVRCNHESAGLRDNDLDSCGVERFFHRARYGLPAKVLVKASIYGATSRRLERWRPKMVPLWAALTLHAHHGLACISREC